ncbi:hypothetical protein [Mesorhizobium sp. SP-1A]|uniref:hypothetical protein n=1 Tax=Mesorhizobium sp. SP-1A TaxID=3077840 RepID=UPI0028F701E2|nr:hypothetical protein [Mesorhizobium sp. SP-1A]
MKKEELESLREVEAVKRTLPAMDGETRTLLFGYTVERETHHVYQEDGELHLVVYKGDVLIHHERGASLPAENLVPNKRLYPERCDYVFSRMLKTLGFSLPFTNYAAERTKNDKLHGLRLQDLKRAEAA